MSIYKRRNPGGMTETHLYPPCWPKEPGYTVIGNRQGAKGVDDLWAMRGSFCVLWYGRIVAWIVPAYEVFVEKRMRVIGVL